MTDDDATGDAAPNEPQRPERDARQGAQPLPDLDYEIVFPDDAERRLAASRGESGAEDPPAVGGAGSSVGGHVAGAASASSDTTDDIDVDESAPGEAPAARPAFERRPDDLPRPIIVRGKSEGPSVRVAQPQPDPPSVEAQHATEPDEPTPTLETFERPGGPLSRFDPHLVMYHEPRSLQAEQYRTCRTNLTALNKSGAPWAVVVTSSKSGEGKSVTVGNLAVCLAELPGARVCLVDTDFRAPTQGAVFGLDVRVGLHELLSGQASWKEAVHATNIRDLDLIVAGSEPPNSAELLGSERFVNLITELKRRYTWILIDTPPVNPFTDACVVSTVANGTLVVVRMQDTPRELVNRTIDSIATAGGRVFGTFLTGIVPDRDDTERQEYYRVEGETEDDSERRRQRQKLERKLRRQERAWVKRRKKLARADEETV